MALVRSIQPLMKAKLFRLIYTSDPLCSFCWAIEPQITKLLFNYGHLIDFEYRMGGLLESDRFYETQAQLKESLESIHQRFMMPIELDYPLLHWASHSLLACQLYLLVKEDDAQRARHLLRKLREAQMLFNQDISSLTVLRKVLEQEKIDSNYVELLETEVAKRLLYQDFGINRVLKADLYPTLTLINELGEGLKLEGFQTFETIENHLQQLSKQPLQKQELPTLTDYLKLQDLILFEEIAIVYDLELKQVANFINTNKPENSIISGTNSIKYLKRAA